MITALLVFRREIIAWSATGFWSATGLKPAPGAEPRPLGNPSRYFVRQLDGLPQHTLLNLSAPAALPCATAGHHPQDIKVDGSKNLAKFEHF
jgi:hypothetical protein